MNGPTLVPFVNIARVTTGLSLLASPSHGRSGQKIVVVPNKDWHLPETRVLNYKGIGEINFHFDRESARNNPRVRFPRRSFGGNYSRGQLGLCNAEDAIDAWNGAESSRRAGCDAEKPFAIVELHELLDSNGEIITVEKAKQQEIIPKNFVPVVYVRGFSDSLRVEELSPSVLHQYFKANKKAFGWRRKSDYFKWFGKRLARNLFFNHKNGLIHKIVSEHNVLANGGLVDNGTITELGISGVKADIGNHSPFMYLFLHLDKVHRYGGIIANEMFYRSTRR